MAEAHKRELTTIQISKEASAMLAIIAASHMRKKGPHAEWLIRKDYEYWKKLKLIPAVDEAAAEEKSAT